MVIMAGLLPVRRRASLCLCAGGRGRDLALGWSGGACGETAATMARSWTTTTQGSDAREAKERLDHKLSVLRAQRQPVVLKRHEMRSTRQPPLTKPHDDVTCSGTGGGRHGHRLATTTAPCGVLLQREVLPSSPSSRPKKGGGGGGRFGWCRRLAGGRCGPPAAETAEAEAECAVCLEDLRAGDVVARLPCAHRFHWSCAVPWVQAVSWCPVCRARAHVAAGPS